jgi:arginine decarboxylase
MLKDAVDRWTVTDASELYDVPRWGKGYFSVSSQGHMQVHPTKDPNLAIDMKDLIDRLQLRGLDLPILLRFNGILKDRLREIHARNTASAWKRGASPSCWPSSR